MRTRVPKRLLSRSVSGEAERFIAVAERGHPAAFLVEQQRKEAEANRKKAKYYTVRRGDALGSIATMWNATTDQLREWNRLANNNIRAGQVLLVRPAIE